jgi:hypothetical protein
VTLPRKLLAETLTFMDEVLWNKQRFNYLKWAILNVLSEVNSNSGCILSKAK